MYLDASLYRGEYDMQCTFHVRLCFCCFLVKCRQRSKPETQQIQLSASFMGWDGMGWGVELVSATISIAI